MMNLSDFLIRPLDKSDTQKYIDLFNSSEKLMRLEKTTYDLEAIIENLKNKLNSSDDIVIGAFYNNKLMCSTSGHYPSSIKYWYGHNHYGDFGNSNLGNYLLSISVWGKCMDYLMTFGEQNNYFNFYARRPLKHQQAIDKIWKRYGTSDKIKDRYDCYYETIYKANEPCKSKLHGYFFPKEGTSYNVDTVVCLFALKQEYRLKQLNL